MASITRCCICATSCYPPPDFVTWWQLIKAAGYQPEDIEEELKYFTREGKVSRHALFRAVQSAIERLRTQSLDMLRQRMDLDWARSKAKC